MAILFFVFSIILSPTYSRLIIGNYINLNDPEVAGIKDAMCRITGTSDNNPDPNAIFTCSATLISDTELLTARHCVENSKVTGIDCGFKAEGMYKYSIRSKLPFITLSDDSIYPHPEGLGDQVTDLAIVYLKPCNKATWITPVEVVNKETLIQILVSPNLPTKYVSPMYELERAYPPMPIITKCIMAGYGVDNDQKFNILHIAKLIDSDGDNITTFPVVYSKYLDSKVKISKCQGNCMDQFEAGKELKNRYWRGDSGGGLLCQNRRDNKWKLVGINIASGNGWQIAHTDFLSTKQEAQLKSRIRNRISACQNNNVKVEQKK